ncbi:3-beta hydroxysteroid dehydrogenase [Labrys miyagiensis]|uniref:3-beta hydroxysteroid dehydrogenase n=1 Tax=Labrys miyagiensis TaxID=346912 RepID=A0ABQ6CU97_9HYPH|nr:NAD(P)-dependent oxidoreductase [Labrys miyagiensis]GLS22304.1 3-beta hydroxysteroid dehydrogenase [Labrys miyagiensis]
MKIAITGATGFAGRNLVRLAAERGHEVVATARGITGPGDFQGQARFLQADLGDEAALRATFAGCDAVIHLAALSAPWGRTSDFERVNVAGTRHVVRAAEAAGIGRLVHVSSSSVYFAFEDHLDLREDATLPPPVNAYAATKRASEDEAWRFSGTVFIARPRAIFGPGDTQLLPRFLAAARRGPLPLLRGGRAMTDLTFVDTHSHALLAMAEAPAELAGTYNVSQGEPVVLRDMVERLLGGLGVPVRWRSLPAPLAFAGAHLLETLCRLDPKGREPPVTVYGLGLLSYSLTLNLRQMRQKLDWRPPIGLDEALERTIRAAA